MERIKAIPTWYKGIQYRSKLEAEWAKFFDYLGIPYLYESEGGYELSDGTKYCPDFYLPDSKQWVEVKGIMTQTDEHKIEQFCKDTEQDIVVALPDGEFYMYDMRFYGKNSDKPALSKYSKGETFINRCVVCGKHSFMNSIGSYNCQICGAYDGDHLIDWIMTGQDEKYGWRDMTREDWRKISRIDVFNNPEALIHSMKNKNKFLGSSPKRRRIPDIPAPTQNDPLDTLLDILGVSNCDNTQPSEQMLEEFLEEYKYRDYAYKNGDLNLTDLSVIRKTFAEFCKTHGYAPDTPAPWSEIRDHFKYERYEVILRYYDQGAPQSTVMHQTKFSYQMITKIYNNPEKYRIRYQNKKDI